MSTATDTFARFVDVLADTLDEGLGPGELASRLHLSRFHCDRLVAAAAGEPPGALRRRILLERAGYRLLAGDDDVLTRAEGLTDDVLDTRVELSVEGIDCEPTLRSLLSRLVGQRAMWDAAAHDRPYDFVQGASA